MHSGALPLSSPKSRFSRMQLTYPASATHSGAGVSLFVFLPLPQSLAQSLSPYLRGDALIICLPTNLAVHFCPARRAHSIT
jgi:hypothetical protein